MDIPHGSNRPGRIGLTPPDARAQTTPAGRSAPMPPVTDPSAAMALGVMHGYRFGPRPQRRDDKTTTTKSRRINGRNH